MMKTLILSPRRARLSLLFAVLLLSFLFAVVKTPFPAAGNSLSSSLHQAAQQDGIYTEAQALRGQSVYDARCASCHGTQLEGGSASPLTGSRFLTKWGNRTVDELHFIVRTQMPYGAGGSLTKQQYIDAVAYLLRANGYRPGRRELPTSAAVLQKLRIESQGALKAGALTTGSNSTTQATQSASDIPLPSTNNPSQDELNAAQSNTTDWLISNHDYSGQRYVDLNQINQQNAAALRPACLYQAGDTKAFHNNPIVYRGVMYITTSAATIALDATSCKVRWRYDRKLKSIEVHPPNRGVALKDGRLIRGTSDGFLLALDIETGKVLWERKIVTADKNEGGFNLAPTIFENLIIMGPGVAEQGIKGWVGAFKLENGEPVWRFNTIPDEGEPGSETWGKPDSKQHGGGAVWAPLSLDPQAGLVYIPVANPAPDFNDDVRPGDNLYTSSMIVLEARTGKLKWHYQAVPHDTHDWDLTQTSPLFSTTVAGQNRRLVAAVGKDGLLHVLDRETKEHLYETPVTTRLNTDKPATVEGVRACPGVLGGVLWNGPAFNPRSNMLYVPAVDWCGIFKKAAETRFIPGQAFMGGTYLADPPDQAHGWLTAVDASTGKIAWRYESSKPMLAAATTTSGDLVFTGELTGDFLALNAQTGKILYRFNTGGPMNGGIVTYSINGKQYVAVTSGSASGFWGAAPGSSTVIIFSLP